MTQDTKAEAPSFKQAVVIWMEARERCEHYHGFKDDHDSIQCSHPDSRDDWCRLPVCPELRKEADHHGVE